MSNINYKLSADFIEPLEGCCGAYEIGGLYYPHKIPTKAEITVQYPHYDVRDVEDHYNRLVDEINTGDCDILSQIQYIIKHNNIRLYIITVITSQVSNIDQHGDVDWPAVYKELIKIGFKPLQEFYNPNTKHTLELMALNLDDPKSTAKFNKAIATSNTI